MDEIFFINLSIFNKMHVKPIQELKHIKYKEETLYRRRYKMFISSNERY